PVPLYPSLVTFSILIPHTVLYTLSLHDALPIWPLERSQRIEGHPPDADGRQRFGEGYGESLAQVHLDQDDPGTVWVPPRVGDEGARKSTRLNSGHGSISYAAFCLTQ